MSSDNGVYVLQTKDGFRVTHAQAIDNIYWHHIPGASLDQSELKTEINMSVLYSYFKKSKVWAEKKEAWHEAVILYREIGHVEYGIAFIEGLEQIEFPKQCCSEPNIVRYEDDEKRCMNCGEYE